MSPTRMTGLLLGLVAVLACSKKEPPPTTMPGTRPSVTRPDTVGALAGVYVKERVKVLAIDTVTRVVLLQDEDGDTTSVQVGPHITRLGAVRAGDTFVAEYLEAVALDVRKSGAGPAKMMEQDTIIRLPGEKPTGIAGKKVTATVQVTAIDLTEQEITVKTGESRTSTQTI